MSSHCTVVQCTIGIVILNFHVYIAAWRTLTFSTQAIRIIILQEHGNTKINILWNILFVTNMRTHTHTHMYTHTHTHTHTHTQLFQQLHAHNLIVALSIQTPQQYTVGSVFSAYFFHPSSAVGYCTAALQLNDEKTYYKCIYVLYT